MNYKEKIKYAELVVEQLQGQKTTEEVRNELKAKGLYERDINNIIISARNILGEKYLPQIRQYLIEDKPIKSSTDFKFLDDEMIDSLKVKEIQKLSLEQKKRITKLIKANMPVDEILNQLDTKFISIEEAHEQIQSLEIVQNQNSTSGRMFNILGGIGLMVITLAILMATGRLFYLLPGIGLIMLIKGLTTERMAYED